MTEIKSTSADFCGDCITVYPTFGCLCEGYRSLLYFSTTEVSIRFDGISYRIIGESFRIRSMNGAELLIEGKVHSVNGEYDSTDSKRDRVKGI